MALDKNTKVALGVGVVIVAGIVVFVMKGKGDVETTVTLNDNNGRPPCNVVVKHDVTAHKNKKVTWEIDNNCASSPNELVTVGNFRKTSDSGATNCLAAKASAEVVWPFKEQEEEVGRRQNTRKIELHIRDDQALVGETYVFDICTGGSAERKSDPRLVIED